MISSDPYLDVLAQQLSRLPAQDFQIVLLSTMRLVYERYPSSYRAFEAALACDRGTFGGGIALSPVQDLGFPHDAAGAAPGEIASGIAMGLLSDQGADSASLADPG